MGLTTVIQTIDDLDVSPGSGYSASFLHSFEQPESAATFVSTNVGPMVSHVAAGMYRLSGLSIFIEDGDAAVMQVALMRALDTTRESKSIVISDPDGGNRRYLMFVTEAINQLPDTAGLGYVATLLANEDIRWRSAPANIETHNFTGTGYWTVTAGGHVTAFPTITVTPRAPKSTPGWRHSLTKIVRWQSPLPSQKPMPLEITGGGWNTAALVTAGEMATGNNIAVLDGYGRFIPHWYGAADGQPGGFNSTTTKIWINASDFFVPTVPLSLYEDLAAESPVASIRVSTMDSAAALPPAGWLRFADTGELASFNGFERGSIMDLRRGVAGTSRADHPAGTILEGGIRPYQIVWDPTSTVMDWQKTPAYRAAALNPPLIDRAASTNSFWKQTVFRNRQGSAAWRFYGYTGRAFTKATDISGVTGGFGEPWTAMGFRHDTEAVLLFSQTWPVPIDTVRVVGRRWMIGYPPNYPDSALLKIQDSRTHAWRQLWNSGRGVFEEDNGLFDETINTPMFGIEDEIPPPEEAGKDWYADNWPMFNSLLWHVTSTNCDQVDIQQVEVTFSPEFTPIIETYTPSTSYDLNMVVANITTGEWLYLNMPGLEIDKSVIISAADHTVTYSGDNSNKYAACRKIQGEGESLMTLRPGDNTIWVREDYMSSVDVEIRYDARYYV